MLMNHLAFRRDTADEQLAVQFAVQVGSPELLQMLYVLTAADLGAVGPDMWDGWKTEVVTDLYHRTMQHLAGESPETTIDDLLRQRREAVKVARPAERRRLVRRTPRCPAGRLFQRHAAPAGCRRPAAAPRSFPSPDQPSIGAAMGPGEGPVAVAAEYHSETDTVQFTIATSERDDPRHLPQAHRGADAATAWKFARPRSTPCPTAWCWTASGSTTRTMRASRRPERLEEVKQSLVQSLISPSGQPPAFRRTWQMGGHRRCGCPAAHAGQYR